MGQWRDATDDDIGSFYIMRFRDSLRLEWSEETDDAEVKKSQHKKQRWICKDKMTWSYCQVWDKSLPDAPATTTAETPAEPAKAGDGWRDAVWPGDWGMAAKQNAMGMRGVLVGHDPLSESPWLIRYRIDEEPDQANLCLVNDRLPKFVMPEK